MLALGVVKSFEASADYQPIEVNGEIVDIGGCMNTLTPSRPQMKGTSSMSPNSCLVQVETWSRSASARREV
jgi:trimethylamine-N-oxide reductase (cytochrome c)